MNVGCNYLREHMIDAARIHYAYSDPGGSMPNVVQSHAVIKYEVRAPKVSQVQELFTRVVDVARGAALMTGTKMNYEITMAFSDYVPNRTLGVVVDECLRELGAPDWTDADDQLALELLHSYPRTTLAGIREELAGYFAPDELDRALEKPLDRLVHPFNPRETSYDSGSTDVGDVGYATPTVMFNVATACLGNVGHSWQNTAFAGYEIGRKGMLRAAEVLTLAAVRTMEQPELIAKAREELLAKNGGKYRCPLPDYTTPPIGKYQIARNARTQSIRAFLAMKESVSQSSRRRSAANKVQSIFCGVYAAKNTLRFKPRIFACTVCKNAWFGA